jgi:phage terminase Nu1 subunit (DNA packaging protein)
MSLGVFVSVDELALEAGVSIRTVQSWAKAGYFSKDGTNSYDLVGYYRWQVESLRSELSSLKGITSGWDSQWREGRARKALAEGKLVELELQKLSQEVLLRDVVAFELDKIISLCIAGIRALPHQVHSELVRADSHDRINDVLNLGVNQVLAVIRAELKKLELPADLVEKCDSFYASYSSSPSSVHIDSADT